MNYINKILEYNKTPFILVGVIFLSSLVLLTVFKGAERQLDELNRAKFVAEEMAKSSDNLTNYARYYVTTQDDLWKNKFDDVIKIRKGELANDDGELISFKDKVKSIGYLESELALILKAEELSNNLAMLEVKAFSFIEKAKKETNFDVQQLDLFEAKTLMFGEDYTKYKNQILKTVQLFTDNVYNRLKNQYRNSMQLAWILISLINLALLVLVVCLQHKKPVIKRTPPRKTTTTRKKPIGK